MRRARPKSALSAAALLLAASTLSAASLSIGGATAAQAGPPAAIAPSAEPEAKARTAFRHFARQWMSKLGAPERGRRAENVQRVSLRSIPGKPSTFRGYEGSYDIELRPTGVSGSPFVGILRYSELIYRCTDTCRVVDRTPVTEIFRFKGDRWIY